MPQLLNQSPLLAEVFPLIDARGGNVAVVIAKATYEIKHGQQLQMSAVQQPLRVADEVDGGQRHLCAASDVAFHKPATDVYVARPMGLDSSSAIWGRRLVVRIGQLSCEGQANDAWPLGPVPPNKSPRKKFAGTYDANWVASRMPLLPVDFDPRFNQVAPATQITPHLAGDEILYVEGFGESGAPIVAALPGRVALVSVNAGGRYFATAAVLDTVVLHPLPATVELVWRLAISTKRSIDEVRYVWLSQPSLRGYREVFAP